MAGPPTLWPYVSVIIPVLNDPERLGRCLHALEGQSYPGDRYEVIVIDNESTVNVRQVVDRFAHAIYQSESRPGSYAARNRGLELAQGEILAFTDADCLPACDWLESAVNRLGGLSDTDFLAGAVDVFPRDPARPSAIERYDMIFGLPQRRHVEEDGYGLTANLIVRRAVFARVGPFDGELVSGGDAEWGRRASRAGYKVSFEQSIHVAHPARATWRELLRKATRPKLVPGAAPRADLVPTSSSILLQILPSRTMTRQLMADPDISTVGERVAVLVVMQIFRAFQAFERVRRVARAGWRPSAANPPKG